MKKYIDIFIDGEKVDTDVSGLSLAIEYSIEETDLGKVRGAHSKRAISLPPTKLNNVIAESINNPASIATAAGSLQPARIEVNGLPVLSGKAQLTNVDLIRQGYGLKSAGYKYAFFGSNADWFQDLGDLRVRDLGWTDRTLSSSATTAVYSPTDETCFTVIKWAEWYQSSAIRHVDHTPALFVSSILDKAFTSIGYSFSSLYSSDPYNRLIIPVPLNLDGEYANSAVNIRVQSSAAQVVVMETTETEHILSHDKESPAPDKDPGDRYNEVGHTYTQAFKAPQKADYRLKGALNIIDLVESGAGFPDDQIIYYGFKQNGTVLYQETIYDSTVSQSGGLGWHAVQWVGTLEADDEIQMFLTTQSTSIDNDDFTVNSIFEVEFEKNEWFLGDVIEWKYIIPLDWRVRDLITDLTRIFNLKWETDVQAGTIAAYPADYYSVTFRADATGASTTSAYDGFFYRSSASPMSRYWDISKGGKLDIITNQKRDFVLDWATDDPTTEAVESAKGVSLYSARWRHTANRFPEGENRNKTAFFAKVLHYPDPDIIHSSSSDFIPQIPLIYPENQQTTSAAEADYDTSPRLLYYAGRRSGYDGYINLYDTATSATSAYDFPAAFMVNYNAPSGVDISLSFCDETTNGGNTVTGLLTRFHAQSLKRIETGRKYQYSLFWDEIDLAGLSFRYKVELNGDQFILQQIDGYNPLSNDSTKTVLLLDAVPTTDDVNNKVSGPVGEGESAVIGGSGGAGAYLGGAVVAGSLSGYYEEAFTAPVAQTIDITVNGGTIPSNKAQIWIWTANGQYISSAQYTVINNEGANDQITFNWTPISTVGYVVRFRYP
jgi:hypothetical protein